MKTSLANLDERKRMELETVARLIRKAINVEMVILFSLLVSTILTLFVIPSLIAVVDDLKRSRKSHRHGPGHPHEWEIAEGGEGWGM
jgi:type II secretory pathway component PulF